MHEVRESAEAPASPRANWTVAHAFGEIVWLMTQSAGYKHHTIADLEWMVMPALLLEQYRIFHEGARPIGALTWAKLDKETSARMADGRFRLRPDQWRIGEDIWIIDILYTNLTQTALPLGMINDFRNCVFPNTSVWLRRLNPETKLIEVLELAASPESSSEN